MGYFKQIDIEQQELELNLAEQALDFDENNYTDGAWWSEQDAEMREQEQKQIEAQAEIQEYRTQGYM
jgi:hypothetical protein